ncbi:isoprenyl transferase [Finegoldia magna]|uniref:Isoprenyl transferase n=2 Tax=Finegoldia magna TaxID=1260 RepID=A0A133MXX2_FINMA|nr:isoprenyl transferase [Finegoldia magna]EFK93442.1 di-trans,poly-cis-decaprenylcistransferase [Finegoldia magna ACS-171-V-Col3]EFL54833.1 di-trans,poly-cis-decaprenylcistransferase [Finegoldia magna BVS033A4]EGS33746.1 di-trans,poly-cis-decaprenylcistransferase [Finegoldia magna SY403409CC001050417]EXF26932.1 UDP pyrophosphate synthase [Finegoldia magna ALB8]KXA08895.1 di-trans,poly-cis-decaprenylcistransferase [Finegoldia magna]
MDLSNLDQDRLPKHIAIIMDGNGRWATNRNKPRVFGHNEGMKRVVDVVENSLNIGIKYLSLYAFSTENWKRPQKEIDFLMQILIKYIDDQLNKLVTQGVKINILGDISVLPKKVIQKIEYALDSTKDNNKLILNIAINYGSRQEILLAVNNAIENGQILTENEFSNLLYTRNQPDVDLLIRPGGEKRLSNFLLYQMSYAELYFSDTYWPDFKLDSLIDAIYWYQNRNRRFGGLK